jgi:hypothetical protein
VGVHNALNRGPLGKALKGALGDQDSENALERWGETLTPVLDMWSMPEWAFLRTERLCGGKFDVTGAAGTIPEVLLFNPADSDFLVVVQHVHLQWVTALGALEFRLQRGTPPGMLLPIGFTRVAAGPLDTRDPRLVDVGGTRAILATGTNAAVAGGSGIDGWVASTTIPVDTFDPIILAPNTGLVVGATAVGVNRFLGGIYWRERLAFQSELGF